MFFALSRSSMPPFVFGFAPPFFFLPFFCFAPGVNQNGQSNDEISKATKQHTPWGLEAAVFAGIVYAIMILIDHPLCVLYMW